VNGISVMVNSNAKVHYASPSLCPVTTLVSPLASGQPPSSDTRVHGSRVVTWHGSIPAVPTYSTPSAASASVSATACESLHKALPRKRDGHGGRSERDPGRRPVR
jgi:hypothetical protein